MKLKSLARPPLAPLPIRDINFLRCHSIFSKKRPLSSLKPNSFHGQATSDLRIVAPTNVTNKFITACLSSSSSEELADTYDSKTGENDFDERERIDRRATQGELASQSLWNQIVEIVKFSGPATRLWICGPLMSLIDTAVIGQGSSIELAALGPGTMLCDNMSYLFMFLSIATMNMVATSQARRDKNEVQHQISILLFIGLACGLLMLLFTRFLGTWAITGFTGPKNAHTVPAANTYVQIRGLAWPAVLVGWVAQSASLGMKDSWEPLKALATATVINGVGDILLCSLLGYGIAGAAWATTVSQIESLKKKGYNAFALTIPSTSELLMIIGLAAPVFVSLMSKVGFYSLIIYFATSMGKHVVAAHQVMIQIYSMCVIWGGPLSQTAQSFMPEMMFGVTRNLAKARLLLKSLVVIGTICGLVIGTIGTSVLLFSPTIFTPDQSVIQEMHKVLIPFFMALAVTPWIHSLEGTLLAGRDLKFMSLSMGGCFSLGALLLLLLTSKGYGLPGCWCALVGFQWAWFFLALHRLLSPDGIIHDNDIGKKKKAKQPESYIASHPCLICPVNKLILLV
ncbi:hypothetical protein ACJRO7_034885 [Eucalyptus globulus]|uniref:Protein DETOXIFICATION n=1 Tax=Eucalyptus globulus TaxID=34317 RepID=A0ABD3J7C2_EUCGL